MVFEDRFDFLWIQFAIFQYHLFHSTKLHMDNYIKYLSTFIFIIIFTDFITFVKILHVNVHCICHLKVFFYHRLFSYIITSKRLDCKKINISFFVSCFIQRGRQYFCHWKKLKPATVYFQQALSWWSRSVPSWCVFLVLCRLPTDHLCLLVL